MQQSTALTRRAVAAGGCGAVAPSADRLRRLRAGVRPGARARAAPDAGAARLRPAAGAPALVATRGRPGRRRAILAAQDLVVTQPTAGTFKCFSATCTHQGCTVDEVVGRHDQLPVPRQQVRGGGRAPTAGPAKKPLPGEAGDGGGHSVVLA